MVVSLFRNHKAYYLKPMSKNQTILIFLKYVIEGSVGTISHVGRRHIGKSTEDFTSIMGVDHVPLPPAITEVSDRFTLVACFSSAINFAQRTATWGIKKEQTLTISANSGANQTEPGSRFS